MDISDEMERLMAHYSVADKILRRMRASHSASVFSAKDFLDFGARATVDKALSRIAREGKIRRVARGLYDVPRKGVLIGRLEPSLDSAAAAIARKTAARLAPTGAQTANMLGVSLQVPAQARYLTDRSSHTLRVGRQILELDHVAPRRLAGRSSSQAVIEALRHLGHKNITTADLEKISQSLSLRDRRALRKDARYAPDWMWPLLMRIAEVAKSNRHK